MVSSKVYPTIGSMQTRKGEESDFAAINKLLTEIDNVPHDTTSIPQESLDLANKFRTSLFPWRGQFSPELIELFLTKYSRDDTVVLDPFVGSGTTLFEASTKGQECYGSEINPSAVEMARTIHFANIQAMERKEIIRVAVGIAEEYLRPFVWDLFSSPNQELHSPEEFNQYFEHVLRNILQRAKHQAPVYTMLVNSVIRFMSLKPPRTPADFLCALQEHAKIIERLPYNTRACTVMHSDARAIPLADASVDLVLTSPPYINVFNYHQNNRPAMELVGWDLLDIAKSEIGSNRKNRQNRFLTVVQYALDMQDALREMRRLLRSNGRAIVVVGKESSVRGLSFHNGMLVAAIAIGACGFHLETRQERKFKNKFGEMIYEDILHLVPVSDKMTGGDHLTRSVARWYLLEASKTTSDEQVHKEVLDAKDRSNTVARSPLFTLSTMLKQPPYFYLPDTTDISIPLG